MFGRGDRSSIGTSLEHGVDSELSGNVIDLCPVGALTNKPFRYSARAWELMAKPSLAAHDGVGSRLWYHTRRGRVMRAVPRDCESTNETWLSDRDRYSHFGLNAEDRVLEPMVKKDGLWQKVSWDEAIHAASETLRLTVTEHGGENLGVLMSSGASTEEYFLARQLASGLDSQNIDHRLREQDFRDDPARNQSAPFQTSMAAIDDADVIFLVGSNIRHEAPILGQRVRKAWRRGAQIAALNPVDWNFHFSVANSVIAAPQKMVSEMAAIAQAVANVTGKDLPEGLQAAGNATEAGDAHNAIAELLNGEGNKMVLLGQAALAHGQASWFRQLSAWIGEATGATLNIVTHGGNATGAAMAGALPCRGSVAGTGLNVREKLSSPLKGFLIWDVEPDFDFANPELATAALESAENVVAVSTFAGADLKACADVILPLAPLAESEGLYYSLDGQPYEVEQAVKPAGQAKPGWKILRRLGAELELQGFDQVNLAELRQEMLADLSRDPDSHQVVDLESPPDGAGLYRVGEVGIYSVDALCRRSDYLQQAVHAQDNFVGISSGDASRMGLSDGQKAKVSQNNGAITLPVKVCKELPVGAIWVKAGTPAASALGDSFGRISVEVS